MKQKIKAKSLSTQKKWRSTFAEKTTTFKNSLKPNKERSTIMETTKNKKDWPLIIEKIKAEKM